MQKKATTKKEPSKAVVGSISTRTAKVVLVILKSIAIFLGGQIVGAIVISLVGGLAGASDQQITNAIDSNDIVRFLLVVCVEIATVWFMYLFLKKEKQTFKDIGVSKQVTRQYIKQAAVGYAVYFMCIIALFTIVDALHLIDTTQEQQLGYENTKGAFLLLTFVSLVIFPPLIEELLFRGYLFHKTKAHSSFIVATVITSVLFGAAHLEFGSGTPLNWAAALDTLTLSVVLCYVTYKTKSLWPAIVIHMAKNLLAFVTLFVLK